MLQQGISHGKYGCGRDETVGMRRKLSRERGCHGGSDLSIERDGCTWTLHSCLREIRRFQFCPKLTPPGEL